MLRCKVTLNFCYACKLWRGGSIRKRAEAKAEADFCVARHVARSYVASRIWCVSCALQEALFVGNPRGKNVGTQTSRSHGITAKMRSGRPQPARRPAAGRRRLPAGETTQPAYTTPPVHPTRSPQTSTQQSAPFSSSGLEDLQHTSRKCGGSLAEGSCSVASHLGPVSQTLEF